MLKVSGCWVSKYKGTFDLGLRQMVDDWPFTGIADLLLMLAEAKKYIGRRPGQRDQLSQTTAYAGNYQPAIHGYPNQPIDADINEALLKERLFEFICEGKRWYDLRHSGRVTCLNTPQLLLIINYCGQ